MDKINLKLNLLFKELLLFGLTLVVGVFAAYRYQFSGFDIQTPEFTFTWSDVILIIILIFFFIFSHKYAKFSRFSFRLFIVLLVFSGTQIIGAAFLAPPGDFFAAVLMVLIFLSMKKVWIHNLGMILGIGGIGAVIGSAISPQTAVIALVVLSFYDIIAVYVTKHMVRMAKSMIESGATFGFIIPSTTKEFLTSTDQAQVQAGGRFMILGSGDIGLPLVMAASVVRISAPQALIVCLFSLVGLFVTHLMFVNQKERRAMAALPPIATMTIIGYLVALIV